MESSHQSSQNSLSNPSSSFRKLMDIPTRDSSTSRQSQSASLVQCLEPRTHVTEFWAERTRPDGRLFTQGRATRVVFGMLKHSAGSALVSQKESEGKNRGTKVLAATTFNIGQPSPEQPNEGEVVVQVSGTGGRNIGTDSRSHRQQHCWDTLQSWLQRALEQDEGMAQSLNLITGKACLRLNVTVIVLEDNGNLKDGALLACMAAWKDTRLPQVGKDLKQFQGKLWMDQVNETFTSLVDNSRIIVDRGNEVKKENDWHQRDYRISLTMGIWVDPAEHKTYLLTDPSDYEEPFLKGNITVIVSLGTEKLQVDYTGTVPLTAKDLALAAKLTRARAKEIITILS